MDKLTCQTCGFDTDDHLAKLQEITEKNKILKKEHKEALEKFHKLEVDFAKFPGDDAKIGIRLITSIAVAVIVLIFAMTTPYFSDVIKSFSHDKVTLMVESSERALTNCLEASNEKDERQMCFDMFGQNLTQFIELAKK